MKLIIASKNVHKIREMRSMLKVLKDWDVYSLIDFPDYVPPEETGKTFEENALLKARHASQTLKTLVLADDSGLVVPALDGAPGIYSARFAGENASDKDNRQKLLEEMKAFKEEERDAHFVCAMAIAGPGVEEKVVSAYCEGEIIDLEKGGQGFGYDPIFQKHEYSKTFAELPEDVKNRVSHRRKAMDKVLLTLENLQYT